MNGQRRPDSRVRPLGLVFGCALAASLLVIGKQAEAQLSYSRGQTISPAYEGWELNPDGSYNLLFGYLNRNWDEELDIPVGADNYFSPGLADRGQPTHFLPRRNRYVFRVHMPADFDQSQEVVWTLTSRGEERKAYASLRQDLLVDNMVIASETGALGGGRSDPANRLNKAPVIELGTDRVIAALIGQPVTLIARVTDDGFPLTLRQRRAAADPAARGEAEASDESESEAEEEDAEEEDAEEELSPELQDLQRWLRRPVRITVDKRIGLHFTWFVYRGDSNATFDPIQIKPWEDTRAFENSPWSPFWRVPSTPGDDAWVTQVTFSEPGTYVLRGRADDGALFTDEEVTINVRPLLP